MNRCKAGCYTPLMGDKPGICQRCSRLIAIAALADGYTVADGVVMKPCAEMVFTCGFVNDYDKHVKTYGCGVDHETGHCGQCETCHGTSRVVAGGGGT